MAVIGLAIVLLTSCGGPSGDKTGHEYMPDMAHSIAYEANHVTYYSLNQWTDEDVYEDFYTKPNMPIKGTIPRGYSGLAYAQSDSATATVEEALSGRPVNGHVPYYYDDTEEERLRATNEITQNPFPVTEKGLEAGKNLYDINCAICHGEKGDGNGYLVRDDGKYPVQPAILVNEEFTNASDGRYYHALIYGKNVMGGYSDKLSYEERWQVIHYIRTLQAKEYGWEYDETTTVWPPADAGVAAADEEASE
ncbi:MAG: cytochrome c [Bacteroidota bacterium]